MFYGSCAAFFVWNFNNAFYYPGSDCRRRESVQRTSESDIVKNGTCASSQIQCVLKKCGMRERMLWWYIRCQWQRWQSPFGLMRPPNFDQLNFNDNSTIEIWILGYVSCRTARSRATISNWMKKKTVHILPYCRRASSFVTKIETSRCSMAK